MSFKIDGSDPRNLSNKVLSEEETRKRLLAHAFVMGCEGEMKKIFNKYDRLVKNCTNDKERKDMAKCMSIEIYFLLGSGGELYVDGKLVAKDN
jgi:hypothetical protein